MVGEIRDPETAAIAMQASMTGHLVLSTLHTNDAPAAVSRLIDMGEEGLRMVGAEHPDLVLVDLGLPGVDLVQLLARLRQAAVADLPVLVMSASDDRHTCDRAAAAGATGFIPKPFSEGQLRGEVAAVLQRRVALAERPA